MSYRDKLDLLLKYTDCDAMSCKEFNETVPELTLLCDELDTDTDASTKRNDMKETINKVKCIEAKVFYDYKKPYLYCRFLVNDKFIFTIHRISLNDLINIDLETKYSFDYNTGKGIKDFKKSKVDFEIQPEKNKDDSLITIEKIYTKNDKLRVFFKNEIHEVKITYVTTDWDPKESKTKIYYGLAAVDKTDSMYGCILCWTEETLKQNEVL